MHPAPAMTNFVKAFLEAKSKRHYRLADDTTVIITRWQCSYCDSFNKAELNCRNCGAPENIKVSKKSSLEYLNISHNAPGILQINTHK